MKNLHSHAKQQFKGDEQLAKYLWSIYIVNYNLIGYNYRYSSNHNTRVSHFLQKQMKEELEDQYHERIIQS